MWRFYLPLASCCVNCLQFGKVTKQSRDTLTVIVGPGRVAL